jgi:Uma2 family endonuclease
MSNEEALTGAALRHARRTVRRLRPGQCFALDRPLTVEEFYELIDEDGNVELIDGVVHARCPATDHHEALFGWLVCVLGTYVEERRLGRMRGSRSEMRIDPLSARQPDLLFVSTEHLDRIRRLELAGPADFIIEIVDSAKARREAVVKQAQYQELGVPELWVVDLPRRELRHFILEGGRYEQLPVEPEGEASVRALPGSG